MIYPRFFETQFPTVKTYNALLFIQLNEQQFRTLHFYYEAEYFSY